MTDFYDVLPTVKTSAANLTAPAEVDRLERLIAKRWFG